MGLRLLVNDYKNSMPRKGTVDYERLDTLQDVHSSCVAALDILNDLLCFNKLESGLLVLHQESVHVIGFIKESIAMFNVQARDCGVTLRIIFEKPLSSDNDGEGDDSSSVLSRLHRLRGNVGGLPVVPVHRGSLGSNTRRDRHGNSARGSTSGRHQRGGGHSSGLSENGDSIDDNDTISLDKFKMDQVL